MCARMCVFVCGVYLCVWCVFVCVYMRVCVYGVRVYVCGMSVCAYGVCLFVFVCASVCVCVCVHDQMVVILSHEDKPGTC